MEPLHVRRATFDDIVAIIKLLADDPLGAKRERAALPLSECYRLAFDEIDSDPHQLLVVATRDDAIVGTLQLSFIRGLSRQGALRGQIEAVRIASSCRGMGLGERLIEWAIGECRARRRAMVQLTSDITRADAHRFYERLGFLRSHVGFKLELK